MKPIKSLLSIILSLALSIPCVADAYETTKYVQGGACAPHKGTKKHPFATLEQASDDQANWDVLIVLSSTVPLDKGITLQPGKKLIGEEDPTCLALSPTQPTIINTDLGSNGGNGVVVLGDATIKNIYFRNTQASAINLDQATDVTVKNLLITHYGEDTAEAYAGILVDGSQSGKINVEHVIIRNADSDAGIVCVVTQSAQRELVICSSEFGYLEDSALESISQNESSLQVVMSKCYVHNLENECISFLASNASTQTIRIDNSTFSNNADEDTFTVQVFNDAHISLDLCSCHIEEASPDFASVFTILTFNNAFFELHARSNVVINKDEFVSTEHRQGGTNSQNIQLLDNRFTGNFFYDTFNVNPSQLSNHSVIMKNNICEVRFPITIQDNSEVAWATYSLCAEHNCFTGIGEVFFVEGKPGTGLAVQPATISAHCNNFIGYTVAISDLDGGAIYSVEKNFWGLGSGTCPCPQYQTCLNETCFGPQAVVIAGLPQSVVRAENPLIEPIQCPHSCCRGLPQNPNLQPLTQYSQEELAKMREERVKRATEKRVERIQQQTA
jgi:hypothetical protein